jgi:catechol 2,3-dioxygenase-like lactoylglutathione lyase family enzyme
MRLGQVVLFVKDLARMRAFYQDALGLTPVSGTAAEGWLRLDAGGTVLALHALPPHVAAKVTITDPPRIRDDTAIKFTFQVEDVERAREAFAARGARMGETRRFGSLVFCDGVDPEGNVFQISNR